MKTTVKEFQVGKHKISFELDDNEPNVTINNKSFNRLDKVTKEFPELSDSKNLVLFSKIANFFFTGLNFEVIEDIEKFSTTYKRLLKEDSNLINYGVFDIQVIKQPYLDKDHVVFYVEEMGTGLPFQVSSPFPYTDPKKPFKYSLLPYA